MPVTQQDVIDTVVGKCTDENLRTEVWRLLADQHSDAARFYTWYRDNCGPDPGRRGAMLTGCDGDQTCMRERSMPASRWPRASTMTRSNDALPCGTKIERWPSWLARFGVYTGVFLGSAALVFLCAMLGSGHVVESPLGSAFITSMLGVVVAIAFGAWLWGKAVKRRVRQVIQQQKYVFRFLSNQHRAEMRAVQAHFASKHASASTRHLATSEGKRGANSTGRLHWPDHQAVAACDPPRRSP